MQTLALGPSWLDPDYLLNQFGLWGLLLIVFAESGLLIGFFLPGDSLLFTTGLLITTGKLDVPLWLACVLISISAILGDQAGYLFGKKVGPALFKRPDSRLFKQENVTKAHEFFEKHGPKSLVLARFVPIVRTFTPIIAGVSGMRYRSFITFNIIGGVLWGAGVTLLGAWLGKHEVVHKNIEAILILIVLISVVPIIIEVLRARAQKKKAPAAAPETQQPAAEAAHRYQPQQNHQQRQNHQQQYPGQGQGQQHQQYPDQSAYQTQQPQYPGHQHQQQHPYPGHQAQQPQYDAQQQYQDPSRTAYPYEGQNQYEGHYDGHNQSQYQGHNQYDGQSQYEGQHQYDAQNQYGTPADDQQYQPQQQYPHQQGHHQQGHHPQPPHQQGRYQDQRPQHPEEPRHGHPRY
ncbi:DedA family protein [Streptomyces sp. CC224B]|uniref:DedA family protein n=1 Tax=Streptomyces sp. CC224B TaxID=3044571 RepID=UPI0024A95982|nr:DedA family protein [Streptomyces sp. CC224B]